MKEYNKELLLQLNTSVKITSEEQFKSLLDWCREEFNYKDIDIHYEGYNGETYIGIHKYYWTWGGLGNNTEISYEDALITEEKTVEKLDFSKITTEELQRAVDNSSHDMCRGISCSKCPYDDTSCDDDLEVKAGFKAELERRLKPTNEQPTLEAGMIVKTDTDKFYICLPDGDSMGFFSITGKSKTINTEEIVSIHTKYANCNYGVFFNTPNGALNVEDNGNTIWTKTPVKTTEELAIEELEQTVETALAQIKVIKEGK